MNQEKETFEQALELTSDEERMLFLREVCGADAAMLERLLGLLRVSEGAEAFLPETSQATARVKFDYSVGNEEALNSRISHYKLIQKLGEGGCGVVYLAEQEEPVRRRVALKVIKLGMDTRSVVARFEAERQALAMMDHPNIAKMLDAGTTEMGRPFFVMELVRGVRITNYCDQNQLSTEARLKLFIAVCQAVQHAHQKGIIHRDLKPSNILVTMHDGMPVPKVIDFGIAKAIEQKLTEMTLFTELHQFMGTPAYMSPEQAEMSGLDVDTRSDIYSLGVLLYELLTGRPPFDTGEMIKEGLDSMRRTIREVEPPRPSTRLSTLAHADLDTVAKAHGTGALHLRSQLQGDLDWIVMKCLEKDRRRRYDTANGLASDLKRHLENEPVIARPPSAGYRLQKSIRRNKLAFTAAAAVALALVLGVVASTWQAAVATQATTNAVTAQRESEKSQQAERIERMRADQERDSAEGNLYAAKMGLAQQAWEANNLGRLRQLLKDTDESPNRGFEWYYWQRQTHQSTKTLRGHLDRVRSAVFSPDGARIVTSGDDHSAKVWDATSGRELLTLKGHRDEIWSVAYSPDGQLITTGSFDRTAKVWEAATGRELLTLSGHGAGILSVAWSPDGRRIATSGNDMTAKVWDASTGLELFTLTGHHDAIVSVAYSLDDQWIATGSVDQTAKVWEAANGRELVTLKGHGAVIKSVAWSPDGRRIATASDDRTAKVWDVATGRELLTLKGHSFGLNSVAWSRDGQRIATSSVDQTARVWDATTGVELLRLKGHSSEINSAAWSPDGQQIVTSSHDQTARVWKTAAGDGKLLTLTGHRDSIQSVAFSSDSRRIVTGSFDRTAKLWEVPTGKELCTFTGHTGWIWSVAYSPNGERIATGSSDQTAKVWEVATGRELLTFTGHSDSIRSLAFAPDGQRIVTGSFDRTAKLWDADTGRDLFTFKGHNAAIGSVAFSPDGRRIVTGSFDRTAKLWDAASGKELRTFAGHTGWICSVAFSPDGERIATGGSDQTAKVWDASTGRELLTLTGHRDSIQSVAFSPNGRRIATCSFDGIAKVWEAATGRELLTLPGHGDASCSVAFSPDGQWIVTGGDRTAKVWEAARAEQVTAWQEEESAADLILAALQRERTADQEYHRIARASDEGAIKSWLILAPIPLVAGQGSTEGLDSEQIKGEARLRPTAGETTSIQGGELKWRVLSLDDYEIDFNALLGHKTERSVAYAVCYIWSESEHSNLQMLVGSNDQSKLYLNGKQIDQCAFSRNWVPDQDTIRDVSLNAGLNTVVFKVVNDTTEWQGSVQFTDVHGQPVKGIKATLNPGKNDRP